MKMEFEYKILTQKDEIIPAFNQNNVPIIFSSDNNYLLYLVVVLKSILENSNNNYNYDFIVLHSCSLEEDRITKINDTLKAYKNYSLRFFNLSKLVENIKFPIHSGTHFTKETYYRFFIPKLCKSYEKLIYMDIDMIVLQDISKLYQIDLEDFLLGVCKETISNIAISSIKEEYKFRRNYLRKNMKNLYNYFNAGLLLFNIQNCLKIDFEKRCLDKLEELKKPQLNDQDILNFCFEEKVKFLDLRWNFQTNILNENKYDEDFIDLLDCDTRKLYLESQKNPYIIHYLSNLKPWNAPHLPKTEFWWHYAKQTLFYEEILYKNSGKNVGAADKVKSHLSYQLGNALIEAKNPVKALLLPLTLPLIFLKFKISKSFFNFLAKTNPSLKALNLNEYSDYGEALSIKKHLSYQLGNALMKNPFTFVFKVKRIYREWKENEK